MALSLAPIIIITNVLHAHWTAIFTGWSPDKKTKWLYGSIRGLLLCYPEKKYGLKAGENIESIILNEQHQPKYFLLLG